MNVKQRKYFSLLKNKENGAFLITGDAGTGKTFLAVKLVEYFIKQGKSVTILCPTHQAKQQFSSKLECCSKLELKTVASFLKQFPIVDRESGQLIFQKGGYDGCSSHVLIVDETSMVSEYEMNCLLKAKSKVLIIFLGDFEQLRPVMKKQGNRYKKLKTLVLTEQQRNAGPILKLCSRLRKELYYPNKTILSKRGNITVHDKREYLIINFLNKLKNIKKKYNVCYLAYRNKQVDKIRRRAHRMLHGKAVFCKGMFLRLNGPSDAGNNGSIIKILKIEDKETQRIASRTYVIFTLKVKNLDNKMVAFIKAVGPNSQACMMQELQDLYEKSAQAFRRKNDVWLECQDYIKQIRKIAFYSSPYCQTIHRAQGRSIPHVYVDTLDISTGNDRKRLAYVAFSRTVSDLHTIKVKNA